MSLHEVNIVIRAINRASAEFTKVSTDAETMAARVKAAGATIAGLGAASRAVAYLGSQFGLLTNEQTRWLSNVSYVTMALGAFLRTSWGVALAQKAYAAATALTAKVTWAFNSALAMKVALLTLGVGLVVTTAAYMAWLASNTRDAADAMNNYNKELERAASNKAGSGGFGEASVEELRRRGIEV